MRAMRSHPMQPLSYFTAYCNYLVKLQIFSGKIVSLIEKLMEYY